MGSKPKYAGRIRRTAKVAILEEMGKHPSGITASKLMENIADYPGRRDYLHSTLSALHHDGKVVIAGRKKCEGCGRSNVLYRVRKGVE